jgi:hypothetical protein
MLAKSESIRANVNEPTSSGGLSNLQLAAMAIAAWCHCR